MILASLGMIFFSYGLISLLGSSSASDDIVIESTEDIVSNEKIMVDIEGAVVKPGVYSLGPEARIKDALIAASGISVDADRDWVEKNLNLAAKIADSSKIYIPRKGETAQKAQTSLGVVNTSGLINLNSASINKLDTLSGVGPVTAQRLLIINHIA
ncbi:MAG: hypothetical protein V1697_02980 [Candidatus Levyibacteriota bacterium]